jgi:drug/metabolite transporter (DMT)-like permease
VDVRVKAPRGTLALLALLTVTWGGNWPAMKLALAEVPPWTFRALCVVIGGACLLAIARARGLSLHVPREQRWPLALATLFNVALWHLCSAYALRLMGAGRASIVAYTMPLWMVLFGWLLYREPVTRPRAAALLLGLAGLAVLIGPDVARLRAAPAGALFMLAAAVAWGVGTVIVKRVDWTISTTALAGWQVFLGSIPVVPGAFLFEDPLALGPVSPVGLAGVAYAVFVAMILCHYLWFHLVRVLPGQVASISVVGVPVVGVISSALLIGEPVGAREVVALLFVLPAIALVMIGPVTVLSSPGRLFRAGRKAPPAVE